jgi:hypothetical protein
MELVFAYLPPPFALHLQSLRVHFDVVFVLLVLLVLLALRHVYLPPTAQSRKVLQSTFAMVARFEETPKKVRRLSTQTEALSAITQLLNMHTSPSHSGRMFRRRCPGNSRDGTALTDVLRSCSPPVLTTHTHILPTTQRR